MISTGVFHYFFFKKCNIVNIKIVCFLLAHFNSFFNNYLFFKFINKCQKEILRCALPSSHMCDFLQIYRCPYYIHYQTYSTWYTKTKTVRKKIVLSRLKIKTIFFIYRSSSTEFSNKLIVSNLLINTILINIFHSDNSNIAYINTSLWGSQWPLGLIKNPMQ